MGAGVSKADYGIFGVSIVAIFDGRYSCPVTESETILDAEVTGLLVATGSGVIGVVGFSIWRLNNFDSASDGVDAGG